MMTRTRTFLPAGILCIGCAAVFTASTQRAMSLVRPLSVVPTDMEGAHGADVKISDDELRVAGVSSYLFRIFEDRSEPVFSLYIGYYERQTQGKTIHSPKNCLPGNGWDFVTTVPRTIKTPTSSMTINRSIVANQDQRALVYYWYQGRGRVAANEYRVKWDLLRDAALHGRTEEALVRIVVPLSANANGTADLGRADSLATDVAVRVSGSLATALPSWP